MTDTTIQPAATQQRSVTRGIAAATIGNMMEWYDFTVYAYFATSIARDFIPGDQKEFIGWLIFGMGFLTRPLGSIVLGNYADRAGRKNALSLTIFLMAFGTGMIAFCPTFQQIGYWAPAILLLARMIQGFSAGGEIGGAVSFLVEQAPPEKRGFFASFQQLSQGGALIMTALVSISIISVLGEQQTLEWGWRIAFIIGILIAPIGIYIRRTLDEAPIFEADSGHKDKTLVPAREVFSSYKRFLLTGIGIVILWTIATYITNYMPTYVKSVLKLSLIESYIGNITVGLILMLCPVVGTLADRYGRRKVMATGAFGFLIVAYPAFSTLIGSPNVPVLMMTQGAMAICLVLYSAPASAVLAELYPTRIRATGVALSYSLAVTLFGGFTPAMLSKFIEVTGSKVAIAYYLMIAACISLIALYVMKDRTGESLDKL